MDHPGGNNPPLGVPFGHGAVFTILRSFVTRAPDLGDDHRTDADEDMEDLPPLEPLGGGTSNAASDTPNVDMPLPDSHPVDPAFAAFAQQQTYEGSMPDLQSVSDSSDESDGESDEHDVAMPPLQTIPDDENSEWSDEDEDLPPLEPVAGSQRTTVEDEDIPLLEPVVGDRRARVEDDHDDDRDRRHPSQRTGGQAGQQGQGNAPPFFAGIHNPGGPAPPGMIELFQTFMGGVGPPRAPGTAGNAPNDATRTANTHNAPPQAPPQAGPHPHHHRHHHHHPVPPVQLMFDMNAGGPGMAVPPGMVEMLFGLQGAQDPGNPTPTTLGALQQLLERLAAMGQAFGLEEKEDPERAKTLVKGLEEVPVGLIRRMEKVGGAPGGHVDEATGEVEAPSCAICWDTLLNQEGAQWARKEETKEPTQEQSAAPADDNGEEGTAALLPALADLSMNPSDQPMEGATAETQEASGQFELPPPEPPSSLDVPAPDIDSAFDPPTPTIDSNAGLNTSDPPIPAMDPPASSEAKSKAEEDQDLDKIVCLPCAHVFHAACLVPWFTRPRQTTCPTCRFNVDPDNLTYVPTPMAMPTGAPAGPGPAPTQAQAGPAPAAAAPGPQNAGERRDAPNPDGMPGEEFDAQLRNFMDENPQMLAEAFGLAQGRDPQPEQPPTTVPSAGQPPRAQRAPQTFAGLLAAGQQTFTMGGVPNGWGPAPLPPGAGGQPNGFTQLMGMFRVPMPIPMPPPGAPQQQQPQAGPTSAPGQAEPAPATAPPQQQRPQQRPQGAGPPPGAGQVPGIGMFTVDFTLFSENPFEGDGVRRQANLFANQIFGGGVGGAAPAPAPGAPANPAPGAAPRTAPPAAGGPRTMPGFPIIPGLPPFTLGPMPMPAPTPGGRPRGTNPHPGAHPRERKTWTPPPAPGPTLRIRVEQREREVGMRCSDTSCGIGPSDEDPFPISSDASTKQLSIRPLPKNAIAGTSVCAHTFHPACLVSAERVAGWGGEDKEEDEVEVACPSCRSVGCVPREEWEEGVRGLV